MHNLLEWSLCVYNNPVPPLYSQINVRPISPTAQFLFSKLPLGLWKPALPYLKFGLTPSFLSFEAKQSVPRSFFLLPPSHHFQVVIFISTPPPRPGQPFTVWWRTYIFLCRLILVFKLPSAPHQVPRSVTHIAVVFSIQLPLMCPHFFSLKRRGIYSVPFRRSRKSHIKSKMNNRVTMRSVITFKDLPLESSFPL